MSYLHAFAEGIEWTQESLKAHKEWMKDCADKLERDDDASNDGQDSASEKAPEEEEKAGEKEEHSSGNWVENHMEKSKARLDNHVQRAQERFDKK